MEKATLEPAIFNAVRKAQCDEETGAILYDFTARLDVLLREVLPNVGVTFLVFRHSFEQGLVVGVLFTPRHEIIEDGTGFLVALCFSYSIENGRVLYVNPLEVWPEASDKDCDHWHVTPERQQWFGCACCPPNLARLIASLGQYTYSMSETTAWVHLFVQGSADLRTPEGLAIHLDVQTGYPYNGTVSFKKSGTAGTLAIRIPGWCRRWSLTLDGDTVAQIGSTPPENGYVHIKLAEGEQSLTLNLDMPAERVYCSPDVPENIGKVAITRGPLVYCIEGADNGDSLWQCALPQNAVLRVQWEETLLDGMTTIETGGVRLKKKPADSTPRTTNGKDLYAVGTAIVPVPQALRFIPYHAWSNRQKGEMRVWITETAAIQA